MSLEMRRLPLDDHPLARTYVHEYPSVERFYLAGAPDRVDSYVDVVQRIRDSWDPSAWHGLERLLPPAGPAADKLEAVIRERGVLVATGQQAGLFTGPLLTIYKALGAVHLAAQLEARLQLPVMAAFSIAAEDHDWAEVNHVHLLDIENRLRRLEVARPGDGHAESPDPPVHRITLQADVDNALDQLAESVPDTEFKADVLSELREAYRPGRGFAAAFQDALEGLLAGYPILGVPMSHSHVKEASRPLLWSEWERREEVAAALSERSARLEAVGYTPQVHVPEGATNLFVEGRLGRDRLLFEGEAGWLRRSGERLNGTELRQLLDETVGRVSPGALLRPVVEAKALPVVAYVGGPSEVAYHAQSQVLFELHGVVAPVLVPRPSLQLVESKVRKVLDKYGLEPDELAGDAAATIKQRIKEETPEDLTRALRELRAAVDGALNDVESAAVSFDRGSRSAIGSGKSAIFDAIGRLEEKLEARVREQHEIMQSQLEKVAVNLYPEGRSQERVLNIYQYLVRYGEGLLERLYEHAGIELR